GTVGGGTTESCRKRRGIFAEVVGEHTGCSRYGKRRSRGSRIAIIDCGNTGDALLESADIARGAGWTSDAALIRSGALRVIALVDDRAIEGQQLGLRRSAVGGKRLNPRINRQVTRYVEVAGRIGIDVVAE